MRHRPWTMWIILEAIFASMFAFGAGIQLALYESTGIAGYLGIMLMGIASVGVLLVTIHMKLHEMKAIYAAGIRSVSTVLPARSSLLSLRGALLCWALTLFAYGTAAYAFRDGGYSFLGLSFGYHIALVILAVLALPQVLSHVRFRHIKMVMKKRLATTGLILALLWVIFLPANFVLNYLGAPIGPVVPLEISSPTLLYILILIVIGPCTEELFFRGYLAKETSEDSVGGVRRSNHCISPLRPNSHSKSPFCRRICT